MAAKISNVTDLFHRFHSCEMQLRQGKIAACLIGFKEVIEKSPAVPKTEKEKNELHTGIDAFLHNLATHKKFKEIFGPVSFDDSDLETNLEFIKSMILAQEEEIVERIKKDDEAAEAQRLEIDREKMAEIDAQKKKVEQAVAAIDGENLPDALEIIGDNEDIREAVALYYNDLGMRCRAEKDFAQAVANYSKAIVISPDDENIHYNIGRAYYEAGNPEKAEELLTSAVKINPEFQEGKIFLEYLAKRNAPKTPTNTPEKKPKGFFKKLLKR